jgi:hypothetical protein
MDGSTGRIGTAFGRARPVRFVATAAAAAALGCCVNAGTAAAHVSPVPASQHLTEAQLRALETQLLGPEHAAEHAAMRAAARGAERHPVNRAVARRERLRELKDAGPADKVGAWDGAPRAITRSGGPNESMPAIHSILLPTGKVLMFGPPLGRNRPREPRANESVAVLFDPNTKTFEDVPPPIDPRTGLRANIYCGGVTLLSDGRVLVTGGYLDYDEVTPGYVNNRGLNHTWIFDPWTKDWARHENLGGGNDPQSIAGGRWYPSQVLMPDGRTAIFGGITESGTALNFSVEVFNPRKPQGDELDTLSGRVTGVGPGTDEFFYSHIFWMPSGRGYVVGPAKWNSFFFPLPSPLNFTQINAADPHMERSYGNGVMLPLDYDSQSARIMLIGGMSHPNRDDDPSNDQPGAGNYVRLPSTNTTEEFDEGDNNWNGEASLNRPRTNANTVLLPDGTMVTVGGGAGGNNLYNFDPSRAERQVEVFDGNHWTLGPPQAETRTYHSTAILLPDGSVLSAGDDNPDATDTNPQLDTYEIYKPPYFFKGQRPTIGSAPARVEYDRSFTVGTPNTNIDHAVLVAPGAATHAVDMNQRVIKLPVSRRSDVQGYEVKTPKNANIALPGHYMLFLVDDQGRPSIASWVALGTDTQSGGGVAGEPQPIPAPSSQPAPGPAPAPAAPAPIVAPPAAPAPAATPRVTARINSVRLAVLRRNGRVVLRVGIGEKGRAQVIARLFRMRGKKRISLGVWHRSMRFSGKAGERVALKLTRAQRRRMRGDVRLRVVIRARTATGRRHVRIVWFRLKGRKVQQLTALERRLDRYTSGS